MTETFIGHAPHPKEDGGCGSSDAVGVWEDENGNKHGYCFSCDTKAKVGKDQHVEPKKNKKVLPFEHITELPPKQIKHRSISEEIARIFGIRVEYSEETGQESTIYIPCRRKGKVVGYKIRDLEAATKKERFGGVGELSGLDLFGQHLCGDQGKMIIVTEGELDAASAMQMVHELRGKFYRVVSIPSGSPGLSDIKRHLEWLNGFESILLCYDQDEKGQEGAKKVAKLFQPGKVRVVNFTEKDANDMLKAGKNKEFYAALNNARSVKVDGVVSGDETWERIKNKPEIVSVPYPDDWAELNEKTYGMRLGEIDTWTSGTGSGKTQILRELQYHLIQKTHDNIGVLALEEPLEDSVEALMSLHMNKRIHLPDVRQTLSDEEMYDAWKNTSGTGRIHYYDHFGSLDDDSLVAKIRYMAKGLDCRWIFLDHLSIVVSEFASEGGERERIDTAMSRLKKLTQELNIWIGLVVHLRKGGSDSKSYENGHVPTLDDLRGSGSIKQLSNSVFATARNQQHPDENERNTSDIHVLKCRFSGNTGKAGRLFFDGYTGRMSALESTNDDDEQEDDGGDGAGTGQGEEQAEEAG